MTKNKGHLQRYEGFGGGIPFIYEEFVSSERTKVSRSVSLSDSLLPRRIFNREEFSGLFNVPDVSVAPLVFNLHHVILNLAVPPDKDGPLRFQLIEACPDRARIGILYDHAIIAT